MPPSDRFSVERVAELAHIELSADEISRTQQQLCDILEWIHIIDELNLADVEPFFGTSPAESGVEHPPIRNDIVRKSTDREQILRNAPNQDGEFYHVPPVFE